jgi:purine-cytosine permease-like protein
MSEDKSISTDPHNDIRIYKDKFGTIEQYGVQYIPEEERRSKPSNLFIILFGGSLTFSIIIIGWFPIAFGLSWWQAASAVVVGSACGAALLAPMGLMGPKSGTNNPVSSGAFLGVHGRLIGSALEATASLAFAALSIWTGGDALAGAITRYTGSEDVETARLICYAVLAIIVTLISVYGHANMVAVQKVMIPTAGVIMLIALFVYAGDFDPSYSGTGEYLMGSLVPTWIASALICGSTVASYGAYAGDWTRHISSKLHANGSVVRAMFIGGLFGMGGPFMWGTFTAVATFNSGLANADTPYVQGLVDLAPLWFIPGLIYMGLASGTAQAVINTYGTGLDTSAIIPRLSRVQATILACGAATALVYIGHFFTSVATGVGNFLLVLVSFTVPWIVIVVIGHFHRKAFYNVYDLQVFNQGERGGIYWFNHGWNPRALGVWIIAVLFGMLFSSNPWFIGAGSAMVGGSDIGFLAAGLVAAVMYPLVLRVWPEPASVYESNDPRHEGAIPVPVYKKKK